MENQIEVQQYRTDRHKWHLSPIGESLGRIEIKGVEYQMGLTPQIYDEPEWCIFTVTATRTIKNTTTNEDICQCSVTSGFKIRSKNQTLTPSFLFPLVEIATYNMAEEYHERSIGTHVNHHKIEKPNFEELRKDLEMVILLKGTSMQ